MKRLIWLGIILLVALFWYGVWVTCNAQTLAAFPGAEGDGAGSIGGRGGRIIRVTSTSNSGAGSLRSALQDSSGARQIVFTIGGTITLQSDINIPSAKPYVTIAGQTAPGGGIMIKGGGIKIQAGCHDIITRGMRFQVGNSATGEDPSVRRATWEDTGAYNVIWDHCSFYWTIDTQHLVRYNTYNITYQFCIFGEPLNDSLHPKGNHADAFNADSTDGLTLKNNLLWSFKSRGPQLATDSKVKLVGNIIGNWSSSATEVQERSTLDAIGNIYIRGTNSPDTSGEKEFHITGNATDRVFLYRNIGPSHPTELAANEWLMAYGSEASYRNLFLNRAEPSRPASQYTTSNSVALNWVLDNVGAIHPSRDAIDAAIVAEVRATTGSIKDCVGAGVTVYWPSGTVNSGSATKTVVIPAVAGGVTADRYVGKTIELDITPLDGTYETSRVIESNTVALSGLVTMTVTSAWTDVPNSTSLYRILNTCVTNTTEYGTYATGTSPTDTDGDFMPDYAEYFVSGGASTTSVAPLSDTDGDGYNNVEEWFNDYYYPHLSPYLTKSN